jgi:hypothetical protein
MIPYLPSSDSPRLDRVKPGEVAGLQANSASGPLQIF